MNEELLSILINPYTNNRLEPVDGALTDRETGETFNIRRGIPVMLREDEVVGLNREYQKKYDWLCYFYDFLANVVGPLFGAHRVFGEIADTIEIEDGQRVLETSIGTGKQVENLLKRGKKGRFFGLDISYGMLNRCRRNARGWRVDLDLVQGNAETVPFADETFDVVYHIGGINFFNDKEKAVSEMIRVARPGAKLYIGDETARLLDEQPSVVNFFYQKPRGDIYDPPLEFIPEDMKNVCNRDLWDGKMYLVSFEKPR